MAARRDNAPPFQTILGGFGDPNSMDSQTRRQQPERRRGTIDEMLNEAAESQLPGEILRANSVRRLSSFYELVYGAPLSNRGVFEADFFVRTGQLLNDGLGGEFDNEIDFDRAFSFLVQQRDDALAESRRATRTGFGAGGFGDRVASRINNAYNGNIAFGV